MSKSHPAQPPPSGEHSTIFTIGYGNKPLGPLLERLRSHRIEFLIDVRSKPYSRWLPDFQKKALEAAFARLDGIKYTWMGDTLGGIPDTPTLQRPDGKPDYDAIRRWPPFQQGIERLANGTRDGHRLCLMCACSQPLRCHRGRLLTPELLGRRLNVQHIQPDNSLISHARLVDEAAAGQLQLFE
jgi:uncharacterized protein (DUF488 family)